MRFCPFDDLSDLRNEPLQFLFGENGGKLVFDVIFAQHEDPVYISLQVCVRQNLKTHAHGQHVQQE